MVASTTDLDAIRTQVEYYFSDSNLPRDKFLRAKTEENEKGFVSIAVLATFKRLEALGATPANIAKAIRTSKMLELDTNAMQLRRLTPLPEKSEFNVRALFAKGWLPGSNEPTIDDLKKLFEPSGDVLSVRIRRWKDDAGKHFKGSVFVEMENPEAATRVAAEEYTISTKDKEGKEIEKELLIMPVDEYFVMKKLEDAKRNKKYKRKFKKDDDDSKPKPEPDANNMAVTRSAKVKTISEAVVPGADKDENKEDGAMPKSEPGVEDASGAVPSTPPRKKRKIEDSQERTRSNGRDNNKDREIIPGVVLKFENFGPDVSREDIREAFEAHGEIAWVDFRRGDCEGHIRFTAAEMAKGSKVAMEEGKFEFGGKLPTFSLLEGDVEEAYWKQMWQKKDERFEQNRRRRRDSNRGRPNRRYRGPGRGGRGPRR